MNLLNINTFNSFGQREEISPTPATGTQLQFNNLEETSEVHRVAPDHWIGGVQMKIADVKHIHEAVEQPYKIKRKKKDIFATKVETPKRDRKFLPPKSFGGMSTSAYAIHQI